MLLLPPDRDHMGSTRIDYPWTSIAVQEYHLLPGAASGITEITRLFPPSAVEPHRHSKMAMEMVENIIRTRSLRRRSDRSVGSNSTDGLSFSKPLRAISLRTSSLPHQVRNKSDLGRAAMSTIQFKGVPGIDGPPNLDQLSPMSYDELYASCDAMSSKTSVASSAKEPEEPVGLPPSEEKQEKHEEHTADVPTVTLDPGALPGLQPSLPSAIALGSLC